MLEIEEVIADAKAEEEAKKEADFKKKLKEGLQDALSVKNEEPKVNITVKEYVLLKQKEQDLDRLVNIIIDDVELTYSKDELRLKSYDNILDAFKVLYPEAYAHLLAVELEREKEGE